MRFTVTTDAAEFAERSSKFVTQRIDRNLLATVLMSVLDGAYRDARPVFAYGLNGRGDLQFAALRTPPFPMLASELEPGAARSFVAQWLEVDPELPGVSGLKETARGITSAWSEHTARTTRCRMREAMHVLDQVVDPPRPAAGALRLPHRSERRLLIDWMEAFALEAGIAGAGEAQAAVDRALKRGGLAVWDHRGPTSMVGTNRPVAAVVRVGPVYTPLEHRRHGYAGSAVAAASRQALERGATTCMLFTDLANPTSNKIYAEVGYRRFPDDWEEHAFEPASG